MWFVGPVPIVERNNGLVFSAFFFTSLAVLTVSMRIYTRTVIVKNLGVDDYLMVAAIVSISPYSVRSRFTMWPVDVDLFQGGIGDHSVSYSNLT